jgi:hypothetical protein
MDPSTDRHTTDALTVLSTGTRFACAPGRVTGMHPWKALFANDFLCQELIHLSLADWSP